ncbi:FSH1-domain-containing protein [Sporormia fimetaria CBS 119925]|uniref:FSH1-domain-containing protein n=1 Tax=Sporormia fimetaria CBS 119925 TaxID=1340428 RepID=A0A6A6VRT3_9PLEO|nr:FSH1-domain-containing protein [Sporormia fimetaria CBS 119925]
MGSLIPLPSYHVNVLMIHGYTQSGPLFRAKTKVLESRLKKSFPAGITLHYVTAPIRLSPADIPFATPTNNTNGDAEEEPDTWAWWRRKDNGVPYEYEGLDKGLAHLADVLRTRGPFDGVIGFSQGGAMAAMLASLLEPGRREAFEAAQKDGGIQFPESFPVDLASGETMIHPPLKFAVSYSGFAPVDNLLYKAFYEPKIKTPILHFLGTLDTVVDEPRSLALVNACATTEGRVVYHPGGHFVNCQKIYVGALIGFMREMLYEEDTTEEENYEDLDFPSDLRTEDVPAW